MIKKLSGRIAGLRSEAAAFFKFSFVALTIGGAARLIGRLRKQHRPVALKVLIIRMDGLGDFVLTTPLLREVRRFFPEAHITLVTGSNVKELAIKCPYVDNVETTSIGKLTFAGLRERRSFVRSKLSSGFDLALLPRWDGDFYWTTLTACLARSQRIIAYTSKTTPQKAFLNWGYDSLVTDVLQKGDLPHELDRALQLVTFLGGTAESRCMELWRDHSDELEADRFLESVAVVGRVGIRIALGIGASQRRKQWPYFAALLTQARTKFPVIPLVFVAPDEIEMAHQLKIQVPECVIVSVPLRVAAALMGRCHIFVGNDSGPLHMAAAMNLPTIEISCHPKDGDPRHEYSPLRFGHIGEKGAALQPASGIDRCKLSCIESFPHCISLVRPLDVLNAIESLTRHDQIPRETADRSCLDR